MRSSARGCEDLLARLFTDAEFRERFRKDPQASGREFGLDEATLATLEQTDWVGLELAARSYAHKRETYAGRKRRWWQFGVSKAIQCGPTPGKRRIPTATRDSSSQTAPEEVS